MKIKSLLLGSAAALVAVSGARAADAVVIVPEPEAVEYVRVCDAYGTGFFYIPGTETCLRVGGRVRVDYRFQDFASNQGVVPTATNPTPGSWNDRTDNSTQFRARAYVRLDSRTETEFGLLRTYTDLWFTHTTGGDDGVLVWDAFVQLGGFTFGRTGSFFDGYTGDSWGSQIGVGLDDRATVLAYTAAFGNGASASISLEDATDRQKTVVDGTAAIAGHKYPDLVANLRVNQGWGNAGAMAVLSNTASDVAGVDSALGFAVGAHVTFNLPMIAPGDAVSFQAVYADGAVGYASTHFATDGVLNVAGTSVDTATAWNLAAGFTHNWTSTVSTSVTGSYGQLDARGTALDVDQWGLHGQIAWSPVGGLVIGTEVEYLSQDFGIGGDDDDDLTATFRVQRTF